MSLSTVASAFSALCIAIYALSLAIQFRRVGGARGGLKFWLIVVLVVVPAVALSALSLVFS